MDVQMSLIAIGVACATAVAVYLVSVFGIREKSFEEAIAEQKKRSDDLLGTHHHSHHKKEKKKPGSKDKNANKKLKKREKTNNNEKSTASAAAVASSDLSDGGENSQAATAAAAAVDEEVVVMVKTHHSENQSSSSNKRSHVEIVDEPEILDDEDEREDDVQSEQAQGTLAPQRQTSRRSSVSSTRRDSIIKSILLNKDEIPPVSTHQSSNTSSPQEPANHFEQIVPKDDCELKKSNSELQLSTPPSPRIGGGAPQSGSNTPVDDNTTTTDSPQVSKKSRSKQKKSSQDDETQHMTAGKIERIIDRLALTSSEIQQLIDVLLNKQHAGDNEWINKSKGTDSSVGGLKKQLELKDKIIAEEQATVSTLQSKLKELRNEFSNEKSKWAGVRRSLEEQLQNKVVEVQNLNMRLRQIGELSLSEKTELQKQLQRMQIKFKDVQDENEAIKADYRNYRDAEQSIRSKADTLERESGALKTQCGHLENQLKNAFASNQEMSNQLRSLQEHVRVVEERKKNDEIVLNNEYRKLQEREAVLLQELSQLKTTLSSSEAENRDLRNQLNLVESSAKGADEINKKYEELRKSEVTLRNLVNELKGQVGGLEDQVKVKEQKVEELQKEVERIKSEGSKLNGDVQVEVVELRKMVEEERNGAKGLKTKVDELSKEVDERKNKNDELRHKNQKLLESLQATEQNLQSKIETSEKLQKQNDKLKEQASGVLQELVGNVEMSTEDWLVKALTRVQEKVNEYKEASVKAAAAPPTPQSNINTTEIEELKEKSSKLEDEVVHYQGMLKETENLLSTLQASINVEESKWVSQTAEKDKEIERLRSVNAELKELEQEKIILESRVNELEARLNSSSSSSSNHNNSNSSNSDSVSSDQQQIEELKKSNATLRAELESTKSKCEQLSSTIAKLEANNTEPYTNGSAEEQPASKLSPPVSPNSTSSSSSLSPQQQQQQSSNSNNSNNAHQQSAAAAAAPPSPNPSTSSPGSTGKEKKKKKGSSKKQ